MPQPLLSICVPTYNRAHRLRVMLQTVLSQAAEYCDEVEVWVSDNASPDDTAQVVEQAARLYPLNYSRNSSNLGVIGNVLQLTTKLARGEFVWVLGDDDLLRPGALARVLGRLKASPELDAIYFNFRCAEYPRAWPAEALGGFDGPFDYLGNSVLTDRYVRHWHELISPESCLCTQVYGHVIRRSVWRDYWSGKELLEVFGDVRHAYPHSCMLAETMMHKPSFYVGEPVLTIFNNGQSWTEELPLLVLLRFPQLLDLYSKLGLPRERLPSCASAVFDQCEPLLVDILEGKAGPKSPTIGQYLHANWRFLEAWRVLVRASITARRPWVISQVFRATLQLRALLRSTMVRLRGALGLRHWAIVVQTALSKFVRKAGS